MKKIILYLFLFFGFFSVSNADYVDTLTGGLQYDYSFAYNLNSSSNDTNITFTGKYLYVENYNCSNPNPFTNTGIYSISLKTSSSSFGVSLPYYRITFSNNGNFNIPINTIFSGSYQLSFRPHIITTSSQYSPIVCNIHGVLFDNISFLTFNNGYMNSNENISTGYTLLIANKNGNTYLNQDAFDTLFTRILIALFGLFTFITISIKAFKGKK